MSLSLWLGFLVCLFASVLLCCPLVDRSSLFFYLLFFFCGAGLSLLWPLPLRSTGSGRTGSVAMAHGPSRSVACGILPDRGTNLCPLHRQADSQPLHHQGSPEDTFLHGTTTVHNWLSNSIPWKVIKWSSLQTNQMGRMSGVIAFMVIYGNIYVCVICVYLCVCLHVYNRFWLKYIVEMQKNL